MDLQQVSNRELVSRLVSAGPGDPAWLEFVTRFQSRIRKVAYRTFSAEAERSPGVDAGPAAEAVEDLTQEVFVRLIDGERRALAQFRGLSEHSIYTYLHSIATNLVRDHFKRLRAQRMPPAPLSLDEPVRIAEGNGEGISFAQAVQSASPGPDRVAEASELRKKIAHGLDRLGPTSRRDRLIFRLFFVEGLTVEEIAAVRAIGLSASGVEKRIRKIRSALKNFLLDEEAGGRESRP